MPIQEKCKVLANTQVGPLHYKITLFCAYISQNAVPGQFVQVRCSDKFEPLLRRPLSIHQANKEQQTFDLLYEVVGSGTTLLSLKKPNEELDIIGPLGHGFDLKQNQPAIIVSGGMGCAPLLFLASQLHNPIVLLGAATKDKLLCEQDFTQYSKQVTIATDDGSLGKKAFVTELLNQHLEKAIDKNTIVYACGPKAMLKSVAFICDNKALSCQVSMEERMACGTGLCLGCVTKTRSGYKKVCDDGPVFEAKEIVWTD